MGNPDFDKRYPAMFQQGGEADLDAGRVSEPEQDEATESAVPLQSPAPKAVSTRLAQPNAERTPEPFPGTASEEDLRGAQDVPEPVPESGRHWNGRAWLQGLGVSVLVVAVGLFCWTAQFLLPTARTTAPDDFHGLMVVPWGSALVDVGVWLLVPGVAAFVLLLLMGARHYARFSRWLHTAVLVLGLAAAAVAWISLASIRLFVEQFHTYGQQQVNEGEAVIDWPYILSMSTYPLIILALGILAAWVIVRPNGTISGAAAAGVAAVLLVAGFLGTFSVQLFPIASRPESLMLGDSSIDVPSWTYLWSQASPQILAVAAAALLCAMVVRVIGKPQAFAAVEGELELQPAKEPDA